MSSPQNSRTATDPQAANAQNESGDPDALVHSTVTILDIPVHCIDVAGALAQIADWIELSRHTARDTPHLCRQICTLNPEYLIDARRDPDFAATLRRADLRVPDGIGILWAARLLGVPLRERVTGSDGIYQICQQAAIHGWRVFFLGAAPGVAVRTTEILSRRYPGLQVAGAYSGSPDLHAWPHIRSLLWDAQPDLLFVAYGHPRQDFWIDRHRTELPATVALGIGGAFDFVAGVAKRAPNWLQRLGLEWLHRLIHQPWRWRRMAKLPFFVALVLWQRITQGKQTLTPHMQG